MTSKYLSRACQKGDLNEFLRYLKNDDNIKSLTHDGNSYLHLCTCKTWRKSKEDDVITIMKELIHNGVDVNLQNSRGETPLYLASAHKWLKGVEFLLDRFADVNIRDKLNHSPLAAACTVEINSSIVKLLLDHGALVQDVDCCTVTTIARTRNAAALNLLYEYGFKLNSMSRSMECRCLSTPLEIALCNHDVKMATLLIKGGADVKVRLRGGLFSIHHVVAIGDAELLALALQNGADIDSLCFKMETPLCWACFQSKFNMVKILIEKGANVFHRNIKGESLMPYAIKGGNLEIVKLLRSLGVEFEKICEDRFFPACLEFSPLSMAAYFNHIDIFNYLIEEGYHINEIETNGFSAIHMAVMGKSVKIVKRILFLGVSVDFLSDKGETALSIAFERGYHGLCYMLTAWCNADLRSPTKEGTSLIEEAVKLTYFFGHPFAHPFDDENLLLPDERDRGNISIIQHALRLRAAELAFSDNSHKNIINLIDDGSFYNNCLKEINMMKQTSINEHLSLYDFLCSDLANCFKLIKFNENEKRLTVLKPFKDFPNYSPMLLFKLMRSVRLKHLRKVGNLFFESIGFDSKLSYDCINILVTYFDIPNLMQFEIYLHGSNVPFTEIDWPSS